MSKERKLDRSAIHMSSSLIAKQTLAREEMLEQKIFVRSGY